MFVNERIFHWILVQPLILPLLLLLLCRLRSGRGSDIALNALTLISGLIWQLEDVGAVAADIEEFLHAC